MQTILSALPALLLALLRHGLTAAGLQGVLSDTAETELLGAFAVIIGLVWSVTRAAKIKKEDAAEAAAKAQAQADRTGPHGTQILPLLLWGLVLGSLVIVTAGCGNTRATRRIVSVKHTVLGIDVAQSMNSGVMPAFRIGLVRSFWQEVPVETNVLYAPEYVASTVADVKLTHQQVNEDTATGARGVKALGDVLSPATHAPTNSPPPPPNPILDTLSLKVPTPASSNASPPAPAKPAPPAPPTNTPPAASAPPAPLPAPAAPGSLRIPGSR